VIPVELTHVRDAKVRFVVPVATVKSLVAMSSLKSTPVTVIVRPPAPVATVDVLAIVLADAGTLIEAVLLGWAGVTV
jgi:hypothetical protein